MWNVEIQSKIQDIKIGLIGRHEDRIILKSVLRIPMFQGAFLFCFLIITHNSFAQSPTIINFSPVSGPIGTTITINGTNFDTTPSNNIVQFNGTTANVTASTISSITTIVPAGTTTGTITVTVGSNTATSSSNFTVTPHLPIGNVVLMNGTTDYIEVPDHLALRPTNLTLEAWINFSSIPSFGPIFNKVVGSGISDTYQLFLLNGVLKATVESFAGLNTFVQITWTPTLGQWYHVAFTYDDATRSEKLYIDGAVIATNVVGASPQYDNSPLYIGGDRDNGTTYYSFPGKIDEARIWSVVRTSTEILSTINTSLSGNEPGLAVYYKMDETSQGAGIIVANSSTTSGSAINGTTFGTSCTPVFTINSPAISSFSPSSGVIGTTVTIAGVNFDPTLANNIVTFNGVAATVSASTATSISVIVTSGSSTGAINVMVGCNSATSAGSFTVNPNPVININSQPTGATVCDGVTAQFTVNASGTTNLVYQWQFSSDTIVPFVDIVNGGGYSGAATNILSINTAGNLGAGYYQCKVNGDFAATVFTNKANLFINATPPPPQVVNSNPACSPSTVELTASGGTNGQYVWYLVPSGGSAIAGQNNSSYITPQLSITTTYYVSINNGTCESTRTPVIANVQTCNAPAFVTTVESAFIEGIVTIDLTNLISDADNNLDISTLQIITQPNSGAVATLSGKILTIDYSGKPFAVTDMLTLKICDFTNLCTTQQLSIEFASDIKVYNAVSPNGDGKNEFFYLQYIDVIPGKQKNKVSIYNRWGDEVFSVSNYNNADRRFNGLNNDGNKLPTGTYFYKITFIGEKPITGFLELRY